MGPSCHADSGDVYILDAVLSCLYVSDVIHVVRFLIAPADTNSLRAQLNLGLASCGYSTLLHGLGVFCCFV